MLRLFLLPVFSSNEFLKGFIFFGFSSFTFFLWSCFSLLTNSNQCFVDQIPAWFWQNQQLSAFFPGPHRPNGIRLRIKPIRLRNCSVGKPIGHVAKICVFFLFSFDGCHFG
jgi:hypothetical protein